MKKPPDHPGGFFVSEYAWRLLRAHTTLEAGCAVAHVGQANLADRADALFHHAIRGLAGRRQKKAARPLRRLSQTYVARFVEAYLETLHVTSIGLSLEPPPGSRVRTICGGVTAWGPTAVVNELAPGTVPVHSADLIDASRKRKASNSPGPLVCKYIPPRLLSTHVASVVKSVVPPLAPEP